MTGKNGKSEIAAIPQPKRLGVGQTADGLIEIEIQLRKYRLFVTEATTFIRFKLSAFVTDTLGERAAGDSEQLYRYMLLAEVWAPLYVCSRAADGSEVPGQDQFLNLPTGDMSFWVQTARELGHSFDWLDSLDRIYDKRRAGVPADELEKEQVKKKSRQPENHPETKEVSAG